MSYFSVLQDRAVSWLTEGDGSNIGDGAIDNLTDYIYLIDSTGNPVTSLDNVTFYSADALLTSSGGVATNASPIDFPKCMTCNGIAAIGFSDHSSANDTIVIDLNTPISSILPGQTIRIPANGISLGVSSGVITVSSYARNAIADFLAKDSSIATSGIERWTGLLNSSGSEITMTGYTRVENNSYSWNPPTYYLPANSRLIDDPGTFFYGLKYPNVTWPVNTYFTGTPETVSYVAQFDAETGGNELWRCPLDVSKTLNEGTRIDFLVDGSITVEVV